MKILFFHTAHPRLNLIAQIQLEILLGHIQKKDEIFLIFSNKQIVSSQTNYLSPDYAYFHYSKVCDKTLKILKKNNGKIETLEYVNNIINKVNFNFNSIKELKEYSYRNINIGMGVASSIISLYRDHDFNVQKNKTVINREIVTSISIVNTIDEIFRKIKPDLIYIFNGRMSTYSPIIQYCQHNNIEFRVFEFTSRYDKFHLLKNSIPHNISYREFEMKEEWDKNNDINNKINISQDFFESQRKGIPLMEGSFISQQRENQLPYFDDNKEIITFFNSSIDEFASVPGWENYIYIYENEIDAIWDICKNFEQDNTKQFILRIHPNLKFLNNTQTKNINKLKKIKNLIIVEPTSVISSYSLIDISSKIITFGSTIGIEACYFKKPSILLGMSFYDNLEVAYIPKSKEELIEMIDNKNLKPKNESNVHIYGYWWMVFGEAFQFREKLYLPENLDPTNMEIFIGLFKKFFSFSLWKRFFSGINISFFKKMNNSVYRQTILRELKPWIKK